MHSLSIVFEALARAVAVGIEHWYAFLLAYIIFRKYLPVRYARAIDSAIRVVDAAVLARQSIVRDLKNPAKPGTWNAETAKQMRDAAVREAEAMLGPQGEVLRSAMVEHGGPEVDLRGFLGSLVDSRVEAQRQPVVPAAIAPAAPNVASASVTVLTPAGEAPAAIVTATASDAKTVTDEGPAK